MFANALGLGFSDTRGVVSAEEAIAKIKESLALLKGYGKAALLFEK